MQNWNLAESAAIDGAASPPGVGKKAATARVRPNRGRWSLERAYLFGARLERADLRSQARLEGANLSGARLERANLSGARAHREPA